MAEHLGASSRRPRHPFPALMAGETPGRVPVHTALKKQTPRRPTRARRQPCPKVSANCGDSTVSALSGPSQHLSLQACDTLTKNCTCANSTGFCPVWTSVLHTTGKATWSKNCTCELHVFGTVWTMPGTCKRMSITLSRSEELHCGISTIFSTSELWSSTVFSTPAAEKHAQPTVELNGLQLDNLYGKLNRQTKGAVFAPRQK